MTYAARMKVYIEEYDLQGDEIEVPDEALETKDAYDKFKQSCINDYVDKYKTYFRKHGFKNPKTKEMIKGYDFNSFGEGKYTDTKENRMLGRVGKKYDKGTELKRAIERIIRNRNMQVAEIGRKYPPEPKPEAVIFELPKRRKWTDQEVDYLLVEYPHLGNRAIATRLMRSGKSVDSKIMRLRKVGFVNVRRVPIRI